MFISVRIQSKSPKIFDSDIPGAFFPVRELLMFSNLRMYGGGIDTDHPEICFQKTLTGSTRGGAQLTDSFSRMKLNTKTGDCFVEFEPRP